MEVNRESCAKGNDIMLPFSPTYREADLGNMHIFLISKPWIYSMCSFSIDIRQLPNIL